MASGFKNMLLRKGAEMLMKQAGGSSRRRYDDRSYNRSGSYGRDSQGQDLFNQARQIFNDFSKNRRRSD